MEDNRILLFLSKHWSKLLLSILVVACCAVWSLRIIQRNRGSSQQDYYTAHHMQERFFKGEINEASLEVAENILQRHPELHPNFDAYIASFLLANHDLEKGDAYARSVLERVQDELPDYYQSFAQTSLLIAHQNFSHALEEAQKLQLEIENCTDYNHLSLLNLLRITFLAEKMEKKELKEETWQQLTQHSEFAALESLFHEGKLTLYDYIKH